ncbi:regulator of nucleoside diphosphate kinase [Ekhidna lutea]|uniref:Regulator of nucleoside diphosphate kinase n=1 Tax=Ekhidna lutea TaxID=447679 RepID=A0A239KIF8_EKHLU|nr:GreA/GreB family elongation factor [Ekhidna lutea]SNT17482.1 regulator of nucleoside diphosphate kinase [Ekhidna lutea]
MKKQQIILEQNEYQLLLNLIKNGNYPDLITQKCMKSLSDEMENAIVKSNKEMPDDIVRLNSIVDVQTPFGPKHNLQIVLPVHRDISRNKISILSPLGSGLIGYAKGDKVKWMFPKGTGTIQILKVNNAAMELA